MIRVIGAVVAFVLAIAGAIALVVYVQGADQRAANGAELKPVFVVSKIVPKGTAGDQLKEFVKVEKLPAIAIQPDIVTDLSALSGKVANADILVGDQVVEQRFSDPQKLAQEGDVKLPAGMQEVTIPLSVQRVVGGAIVPGSTVGVVYTAGTQSLAASEGKAVTQFIYHRMLVIGVTPGTSYVPAKPATGSNTTSSSSSSSAGSAQAVSTVMVTLAATTPQVEKLVYGAEQQQSGNGGIWLTLEPEGADESGSAPRSGENIFG